MTVANVKISLTEVSAMILVNHRANNYLQEYHPYSTSMSCIHDGSPFVVDPRQLEFGPTKFQVRLLRQSFHAYTSNCDRIIDPLDEQPIYEMILTCSFIHLIDRCNELGVRSIVTRPNLRRLWVLLPSMPLHLPNAMQSLIIDEQAYLSFKLDRWPSGYGV